MSALRFLAIPMRWHTDRHARMAESLDLEVHRLGSMLVYLSVRAKSGMQRSDDAMIIGTLHDRSFRTAGCTPLLDHKTFSPSRLLNDFWGDYICLRAAADGLNVYRSPSGGMPAYYRRSMPVIASDCDLLIEMGFASGAVDWQACARDLIHGDSLFEQSALEDVAELLPGGSLWLDDATATQGCWWNPWDHVAGDGGGDERAAIERLRFTISDCQVQTTLACPRQCGALKIVPARASAGWSALSLRLLTRWLMSPLSAIDWSAPRSLL